MPDFFTPISRLLAAPSEEDPARAGRDSEEFDALYGETIDLLPLAALAALSEHPRAA